MISFLGRLHEIKGNDFLVKGFARLQEVRDDCHLALIGPDDGTKIRSGPCQRIQA